VNPWAAAAAGLAATLAATPLAIALARRTGMLDTPSALKPQAAPVPYLGGLAVFAGAAAGGASGRPSVLLALGTALLLGAADDRYDLPPAARIAGQVAVGAAVAATSPVQLPGAAGTVLLVPVTALLVNGVNLLDGLDMLASGVCGVAAVAFALQLGGPGRQLAAALAGALAGFLAFNRPPARVYLGDGGSYLLGTALAVLLAGSWAPGSPTAHGVAGLAIVAVPVGEVVFAMVRRARGRRSPLAGDRGHPYDRLVARGWAPPASSGAYTAAEALIAGVALAAGSSSTGAAVAADVAAAGLLLGAAGTVGGLAPGDA
jgi:UDP-GlcNAc:undecaprenyl-phosphate GlcNAc-1-phosphate transferase